MSMLGITSINKTMKKKTIHKKLLTLYNILATRTAQHKVLLYTKLG